jgi:integrase
LSFQDRSYLALHGRQWRVQVPVPEKLRPIIGKAKLVVPLHTDSLAIANRDKHQHVHALKQRLAEAEIEFRRRSKFPPDPLVEEAMEWRAAVNDPDEQAADNARWALDARREEVARREGEERAGLLTMVATAVGTPITSLVEDWLAEKPMKPRQKIDYRRAVTKFEAWMTDNRMPAMVEYATRQIAGDYKTRAFVRRRVHWKTTNKDLSALMGFWKWLEPRGIAKENIWKGQLLPKQRAAAGAGKRPYTDKEITALFAGSPSPVLRDAMMIAALSGMRIEELCSVRVGDIESDLIDLKGTKTVAAQRIVPIHSGIREIIARRTKDKTPADYLFHELPMPAKDSAMERSQRVSKAFTNYRRRIGVDERAEGARQSNIDFHSFRRWFAQKARDACLQAGAGFSPWTLAEVIGHSKEDMPLAMTMGRYPGDETLEAKRACVEAVKLP